MEFVERENLIKLTKEIINDGKSKNGGWSSLQFACFGINVNSSPKGWKKHLEQLIKNGEVWLPKEQVLLFLKLKNKHL